MNKLYILLACFIVIGGLSAYSIEKTGDNTLRYVQNTQKYANITLLNQYHMQDGRVWLDECGMFECSLTMQLKIGGADLNLNSFIGKTVGNAKWKDIEYQATQTTTYQEPVYGYNTTTSFNETNKTWENTTTKYITGYKEKTKSETVWLPLAKNKLDANTDYIIRQTFTRTDRNGISDLLPSLNSVDLTPWAWWNTSYANRMPINCTGLSANQPFIINGSTGFTIGTDKQYVWTTCGNGQSLYYNNATSYAVANDTVQFGTDVIKGNGTSYNPLSVWNYSTTNISGAWFFSSTNNLTAIDHAGNNNLTNNTAGGAIITSTIYGDVFQSGASLFQKTSSVVNVPILNNSFTLISFKNSTKGSGGAVFNHYIGASSLQEFCAVAGYNISGVASKIRIEIYGRDGAGGDPYATDVNNSFTVASFWFNGTENVKVNDGASSTAGAAFSMTMSGTSQLFVGKRWDTAENYQGQIAWILYYNDSKSNAYLNAVFNNTQGTAGYGTLGGNESAPANTGNLTVNYTTGGLASGSNSTFTPPANLTINATAISGYYFVNWTTNCNGTFKNASNLTTQIEILNSSPCYAQANFNPYANLTVNYGAEGTATGNATNIITPTDKPISATPNANFSFSNWTVSSGTCTVANAALNTTTVHISIGETCVVLASFLEFPKANLTVMPFNATGGTATGNKTDFHVPISYGISASPKAFYMFLNWTVTNGTCSVSNASAENTSATITISENCTIVAYFAYIPNGDLAVTYGDGGTAFGSVTTTATPFTTPILAVPNANYTFNVWTYLGACSVANVNVVATTATVTAGSCIVSASFTPPVAMTARYINYPKSNGTGFGGAFDYSASVMSTATGNPDAFGLLIISTIFIGFYIIGSRYTQERALVYSTFVTTVVAFLLVSGNFLSPNWLILSIIALLAAIYFANRVG